MAHHEKLRTDDFDERGRNQYEHNDTPRHGRPPGNTYEERYYGHSRSGEDSRPTYAGSGSINNYGQRGESRGYDQRSRQNQDGPQQRHQDDDRRFREPGNQPRGFNSGPQGGGSEYYRRDNSQFRSYNDVNERREYPARRDDDAPSYIHYSHQRPGGITPRDYHADDARVRGHEASRGRDQYSRSAADRGHDPYAGGYNPGASGRNDQPQGRYNQGRDNFRPDSYGRDDDRRNDRSRNDEDRDQRGRYDGSNRDGGRSDFGYGDDYSSSLYDPNSRNSAFRRRDDHDEDRNQDDRNNRRWTDTPDLDNRSYR